MAPQDPIQQLRDLIQKRLVELATEMQPKSRRILKELFKGLIAQTAGLRDAVEELKYTIDRHSHGVKSKKHYHSLDLNILCCAALVYDRRSVRAKRAKRTLG